VEEWQFGMAITISDRDKFMNEWKYSKEDGAVLLEMLCVPSERKTNYFTYIK
jgi:hypothetical protein